MADRRHLLGQAAEDAVASWLERCGWHILARRHRSASGGEVDLIALDSSDIFVAVEVRARRSVRAGSAATSLDAGRVSRLGRTLAAFANASEVRHRGMRIDLVTAEPAGQNGEWRLRRLAGIG
jgi:putative endonuclease